MKRRFVQALVGAIVLAGWPLSATAQQPTRSEVNELKHLLERQEESIKELKARIKDLESRAPAPAPAPVAAAPKQDTGKAPSPVEELEARTFPEGRQAKVPYHNTFNDQQEAVAQPGDYVLDPKYRGFIPIPRTAYMIKFNPKPRLDMIFNTKNPGDARYRFATALLPLEGDPRFGSEQFDGTANGSQLRLDLRAPGMNGNFRFYYQNDFFGSDTSQMKYRLQHLYGQFYGVVAGYTYGVFEDPDSWPDTVDYEGPNSLIFARRPLVHYVHELAEDWSITGGVEAPQIAVDTSRDVDSNNQSKVPDAGFNVRWTPNDSGHLQFSTIMRGLSAKGGSLGEQTIFGWGVNLGGSLNAGPSDVVQVLGVYGEGIGGMGNDSGFENTDAAFNSKGELQALPYASGLAALTHSWTPRWRSTATFGYVHLDNTSVQLPTAYHSTRYGSVNLMYQLFKRMTVGVEGLYGFREVKGGDDTSDVFRVDLGLVYSPFD